VGSRLNPLLRGAPEGRVCQGAANNVRYILRKLYRAASDHALVLQTDFGLKTEPWPRCAVSLWAWSPWIMLFDLSHENTPYDIWEAA